MNGIALRQRKVRKEDLNEYCETRSLNGQAEKKKNSKGDRKHTTRELRRKPEMCSAMAAKRGETIIRE